MRVDQSTLHIHLLGDLRISRGDEPIPPITSARAQSLLAYLVLHAGVPQSRRHLAFLLWPDSSDEQSRSNLRKLLHDLRRALPDVNRFIQAEGPNIVWRSDAPFTLDVAELEQLLSNSSSITQLQKAVSMYRGPLFQSCYDDWVLAERERLHQRVIDALGRLVEQLELAGEYRRAIQQAQLLLQHDPLHEEVYRTLMRLYALTDDRAAALHTYQTCQTVLRRELDVEPAPATRQAYERLRTLPPASSPASPARTEESGPLAPASPPLIGRTAEWTLLQSVWKQVAHGHLRWVLLTGAPGIGKTRLAEELGRWAAKQGLATATARGYAAEPALGYAPLTTWLRSRPLPELDPVWLAELERLLPELKTAHPELAASGPLREPWQRLRFFEALARALLAFQPGVLILDDLQYWDRDSLDWLHYWVRSNPAARLLLVSTLSREEIPADSPLPELLASVRRAGLLVERALRPLSRAETVELAAQADESFRPDGADSRSETLYQVSEGNPLFILEWVRAGLAPVPAQASEPERAPLPHTLEAVMARRLSQLSPPTKDLAQVAAVIGRAFRLEVLARASGASEAQLVAGLSELRRKHIVREPEGETYDFDHSALREVAYRDLNPAARQMWHRKVAEALVEVGAGAGAGASAEIARHFQAAGLARRAAPYAVAAGDAARRQYAHPSALHFYRQALAFTPESERGELYLRMGKVLELTGQSDGAESHYYNALGQAIRCRNDHARAEAEMALGELLHRRGQDPDALKWLERARRRFQDLGDMQAFGRTLQDIGIIHDLLGNDPEAVAYHETRLSIASQQNDRRSIAQSFGNIGLVYWHQGNYARALDLYARQLNLAHELDDRGEMARSLEHQGMVYLEQGDYARAQMLYAEALDLAEKTGDRLTAGYLAGHLGRTHYAQSDHARARELYSRQLEIMTDLKAQRGISDALRELGLLYHEQGEYASAYATYSSSLELALAIQDQRLVAMTIGNLAALLDEQGDASSAMHLFGHSLGLLYRLNMPYALSEHLLAAAICNYRNRRYAESRKLAAEAIQIANKIGRREIIWRAQVLSVLVRGADKTKVQQTLEQMIAEEQGEPERAALHYGLWRLDPKREESRKCAARLYRSLHARAPKRLYRTRYFELTGTNMKAVFTRDDLPAPAKKHAPDLTTLRSQIDSYCKGLETSPMT